jgi:phosphoglycolate phosphatase-like HAD superfamily hydrolase
LKCLEEMFGKTGDRTIVHVGDHIADVLFARNLGDRLGPSSRVVSVVITHSGAKPHRWRVQPDEVIENPATLIDIVHMWDGAS